jgi:lysine 2,3-aminomutase
MKQLRGRFSGLCQPTYVLDIPGGHGKTPIGPNYIETNPDGNAHYYIRDYQGKLHDYPEK